MRENLNETADAYTERTKVLSDLGRSHGLIETSSEGEDSFGDFQGTGGERDDDSGADSLEFGDFEAQGKSAIGWDADFEAFPSKCENDHLVGSTAVPEFEHSSSLSL